MRVHLEVIELARCEIAPEPAAIASSTLSQ